MSELDARTLLGSRPIAYQTAPRRYLIQRVDEGEQTVGGIIIPRHGEGNPQQPNVIAAETGTTMDHSKRIPLDVTVGDTILLGTYSGQGIKFDGEESLIMKEDHVLAIIQGETAHETRNWD
jgi:chaperonin GroES